MGNLPNSRTITINTGDPIPPSIINELEDNLISHSRKQWKRTFWPVLITDTATIGSPVDSGSNVPPLYYLAGGTGFTHFAIPADNGDTFVGLEMQVFGNGVGDLVVSIYYGASQGLAGSVIGSMSITNPAASWNLNILTATPQLMAAGGWLSARLNIGAGVRFGFVTAVFQRLP